MARPARAVRVKGVRVKGVRLQARRGPAAQALHAPAAPAVHAVVAVQAVRAVRAVRVARQRDGWRAGLGGQLVGRQGRQGRTESIAACVPMLTELPVVPRTDPPADIDRVDRRDRRGELPQGVLQQRRVAPQAGAVGRRTAPGARLVDRVDLLGVRVVQSDRPRDRHQALGALSVPIAARPSGTEILASIAGLVVTAREFAALVLDRTVLQARDRRMRKGLLAGPRAGGRRRVRLAPVARRAVG